MAGALLIVGAACGDNGSGGAQNERVDEDDTRVGPGDASFPFHFATAYRLVGLVFGVTPHSAYVDVGDDMLVARFGPWLVRTPVANVAETELTGPYRMATTIGPAHLSLADRGLTFATNPNRGVCLRFREPVAGIDPWGRIRHPGLTVTVADPSGLATLLAGHPARSR